MGLRDATRDSGACRGLQACAEDQGALGSPPAAKALPQAQARRQVAERHPVKEGGVRWDKSRKVTVLKGGPKSPPATGYAGDAVRPARTGCGDYQGVAGSLRG